MNIKTKFNIGDTVFFMVDNRVRQDYVRKIVASVGSSYLNGKQVADSPIVGYIVLTTGRDELSLREHHIFSTKAALLKSL